MTEVINEAVEAPVVEETTETTSESTEETIVAPEAESEEIKALHGEAEDGTTYDATSPAVLAYQARFPEVTDIEQVIGSILNMHNIIARGETPAGEGNETILEAIKANLPAKE